MNFSDLNKSIIQCQSCEGLREHACSVRGGIEEYSPDEYWSKPVPGFGDINAKILIVGLAPGNHGANRTGRVFTGDIAGDYLFRSLYKYGFTNKCFSEDRFDGLELKNIYITNALKCVPIENSPKQKELNQCREFLTQEILLLKKVRLVLTLGKTAFNEVKDIFREIGANVDGISFNHGSVYNIGENYPLIKSSIHPSGQNFSLHKMTTRKLDRVIEELQNLV